LTVTEGIGIFDSLASSVKEAVSAVQDLESNMVNIDSVLGVIKEIAEQTNLLALNAAIEAARAGEQGRGFAVVADEVRTLANRTHNSTNEIHDMIEVIQAGVNRAVSTMNKISSRAQEGVDQVEASAESLGEIAGAVGIINDLNTEIASAAEEQNAVSDEINRNISNISTISHETADVALQTVSASQELADLAEKLHSLVAQFDAHR